MFFITCFSECKRDEHGWLEMGASRVFGYYEDFETCEQALNENWCDMFEYLYTYAVVEHIEPGIHSICEERWFFEWDNDKKGFFRIEEPKEFEGFINIALG